MRAGRDRLLRPHQVRELARQRRRGVPLETIAERMGIAARTVADYLRQLGLTRCRTLGERALLEQLKTAQGFPRLELARRVIDLEELLRLPSFDREPEVFGRIRGREYHRNQFARMKEWCSTIGVRIERVEEGGEAARIVLDVAATRRVLTPRVLAAALRIRLTNEARK